MRSRLTIVLFAAMVLAGCAGSGATALVPGSTTAAEVETRMGVPAEKLAEPGGNTVWFYPGGRLGRETHAVRLGPDGLVRDVEQRLTEANIRKIVADRTTIQEVRTLMGPPYHATYYPLSKRHSWSYPMVAGPILDWMILWVEYDDDGVVRKVTYTIDPERNTFSTDRGRRR